MPSLSSAIAKIRGSGFATPTRCESTTNSILWCTSLFSRCHSARPSEFETTAMRRPSFATPSSASRAPSIGRAQSPFAFSCARILTTSGPMRCGGHPACASVPPKYALMSPLPPSGWTASSLDWLRSYRLRPSISARRSDAASVTKPSCCAAAAIHSKSIRTSVPPASNTTASSSATQSSGLHAFEHEPPAFAPPRHFEEAAHRARVETVLDLVHALLEARERVVVANLDRGLRENRAAVETVVDDV